MRLFVALDLPEDLKASVAAAIAPLQGPDEAAPRSKSNSGIRWARAEGLHLTLVFLGETPEPRLPGLCATLDAVAARHAPFGLRLHGSGTFGRPTAPRVLWLGVEGDVDRSTALQAELAAALGVVEERPWVPHLTLGRARSDRGEPSLIEACAQLSTVQFDPFACAQLTLFETRGGRYVGVHRAPLIGQIP